METRPNTRLAASVAAIAAAMTGAAFADHHEGAEEGAAMEAEAAGPELMIPSFAEAEPQLYFPACVGIARMEGGSVTELPVRESALWDEAFDRLGESVGRTVAVLNAPDSAHAETAIENFRLQGEERELNYIVIYEMAFDEAEYEGARAFGKLHAFPPFEGEDPNNPARAAGTAVLLDVNYGAVYGLASAATIDNELDRDADIYDAEKGLRPEAYAAVVTELAHEVETIFVGEMVKAGMPVPEPEFAGEDADDMTEADRIAAADRAYEMSHGEGVLDRGC